MKKYLMIAALSAGAIGFALPSVAIARDRADRVELTANQINDQSRAHTARIKADLRLTPEQEKNWAGFENAMIAIDKTNAERRVAMKTESEAAKAPVDIIAEMREQAKFMNERSVDRKTLADAAQPLYVSLNDQQKQRLTEELRGMGHRRDAD